MNYACQNQIDERTVEPNSNQKQLSCTQFGVSLISEQREDRRMGKQLASHTVVFRGVVLPSSLVNNRTALKI